MSENGEGKGSEKTEEIVKRVPPGRRRFMRQAATVGFAVPVVSSFSMSGVMTRPASAGANMS